jgi:Tol biopolymer transport system component
VHDFSTGVTTRVSVARDGTEGNGAAVSRLSLSADGRYVAFTSQATNLAPNDTNSFEDAFVHDRVTGATRLVDEIAPGRTASIGAFNPSMSRDGRRVAFQTQSPDLVADDTNGKADVFVRDMVTNTTLRVSLDAAGHQIVGWDSGDASISADGKRVAFGTFSPDVVAGDTNGKIDLFVRDLASGETTRVSIAPSGAQPMAHSQQPRVADGSGPVAFMNADDALLPGDGNGWPDVFFHTANGDLQIVTRKTTGIPNAEQTQPALDADGSVVAFVSDATNLVRANQAPKAVFVRDEPSKTNEYASVRVAGTATPTAGATPALNGDGNLVAFTTEDSLDSDAGFLRKVYVRDRAAGTVSLASVASNGTLADGPSRAPSLSTTGRYVAFLSTATNLVAGDTNGFEDAFVHDRVAGTTTRVDIANDGSEANAPVLGARMSGDGSAVVFWTAASNLVPNDTNGAVDVFVRDVVASTTTRVSVDDSGAQANGDSRNAAIDGSGEVIVFESSATDLVAADTNGATDVFVHRLATGTTTLVSRATAASDGSSTQPSLSTDGARVAFQSLATNLVTGDTNGVSDIFIVDLPSGYLQRASEPGSAGQSNGASVAAAISGDGKKVAYETDATNIVSKDVNDVRDVVIAEVKSPPSS